MNCASANRLDLVDYLFTLGFSPQKIKGAQYWYLSPLRIENNASFKVDRHKNLWYDHGTGQGGGLVDFTCAYFRCDISEALQHIESRNAARPLPLSFRPQKAGMNFEESEKDALIIQSVEAVIKDTALIHYLDKRNIPLFIAQQYCQEISFRVRGQNHIAIGFKNQLGGYELRSERFKGSSAPKYVSYFDKGAKTIRCFEGFFDFLTYQSLGQRMAQPASNFLILNSLSFFRRSLLLMEKHERMHLYLDHDEAGRQCLKEALKRTDKVIDESRMYKGCKDLSDWWQTANREQQQKQSRGLKL